VTQQIKRLPRPERIKLAKAKMEKLLDYFLYVLELHANNSFVVFSPLLASQIPRSHAAHAFNVFQRSMYQIEIVRLCAIWDSVGLDKEDIPTVVKLINDDEIIEMLAEEARSRHMFGLAGFVAVINPDNDPIIAADMEQERAASIDQEFANEQASKARTELRQAIADAHAVLGSPRLASITNDRDKHIAHSLEITHHEKRGPIQPMKYGDETKLLNASIPILERLYCWVNGTSFSIANSQEIDQQNAEALYGVSLAVETAQARIARGDANRSYVTGRPTLIPRYYGGYAAGNYYCSYGVGCGYGAENYYGSYNIPGFPASFYGEYGGYSDGYYGRYVNRSYVTGRPTLPRYYGGW
jgi:hypothetical protein